MFGRRVGLILKTGGMVGGVTALNPKREPIPEDVPGAVVCEPDPDQLPWTSWYGGFGVIPPAVPPVVRLSTITISALVERFAAKRAAQPRITE